LKTLIVYASTYGFTEDCVKTLCRQINGSTLAVNIIKTKDVNFDEFDTVVIGGSIYMGQIQKQVNDFCVLNIETLKQKNIALFLSCALTENFEVNIKNSFPTDLIAKSFYKSHFGGELRLEKMKFAHKMITNLMQKAMQNENTANKPQIENISFLAEKINCISTL
jgi:menaquinone-dependent protoporphyrinogen oxidase